MADPITTDVVVYNQGINIEVETIAPMSGFDAEAFDFVNMTITPTVESPTLGPHGPVPSAEFKRIAKEDAEIIRLISAVRPGDPCVPTGAQD